MGSYADSLLTQGETVIRRERQHWLSLFIESRLSILLWGIALLLLFVVLWRGRDDGISSGLSLGAIAIILVGLVFFLYRWWHWKTDEYVITTRRLLKVEGIINKRSGDSNLEKINDAILEQNLVGRILDYGDLKILTAAEISVDHYRMLNHAKAFKKQMMTAKHALEDGRPYGDVPTAPVMATAPMSPTRPAESKQTERVDSPEEVAQSLSQLAMLRDSGAITSAEYDAKKQELLGQAVGLSPMELNDNLIYALLAVGIMLLVGFPVHEFFHAFAAHRLGDSTARWQGRLTLDPRVHFDPVGGMMLVITAVFSGGQYFFGFAKPTPVNPMNLQGGRHGEALVAAAGPLSNLAMAAIVAIPLRILLHSPQLLADLPPRAVDFLIFVPYYFVAINVFLCIFNLLPVPPLDGWKVLGGLVPPHVAWQMRAFEQRYAQIIPLVFLAVILIAGARIIGPIADAIINILLGT